MTNSHAFVRLISQCDIYFENSLISRESIIQNYMKFFASAFDDSSHALLVAQHPGSVCFDAVSFLFAGLGCLAMNETANEDIVRSFEHSQMVLYNKERYRWRGFAKKIHSLDLASSDYVSSDFEHAEYAVLEQPSRYAIRDYVPRNRWNRMAPYNGSSTRTDGRGIRRTPSNRNDFLSYLFDMPMESIPSVVGVSTVIVTDREAFNRIADGIRVEYGKRKTLGLLDLVTASYYTSNLEEHQYRANPSKTEPNLKITSKISTARDLVLDKSGNKTVGFMVVGNGSGIHQDSELLELLDRHSLTFSMVTDSVDSTMASEIVKSKPDASLFVCTKEFLLQRSEPLKVQNPLTIELDNQIDNILNNEVLPVTIEGVCSWVDMKSIKNALHVIRHSDIRNEEKDNFIITAHTLTNLALTAVFPLSRLNQAFAYRAFPTKATPPSMKLQELWESAGSPTELTDQFLVVADTVDRLYHSVLLTCPKYDTLMKLLIQSRGQKIALVVPKGYYVDLLQMDETIRTQCATIVTANQFNHSEQYDLIIVAGDFVGTQFNPLTCRSAATIIVLLYNGEAHSFRYKQQQSFAHETSTNVRLGLENPHNTDNDAAEADDLDDVLPVVAHDSDLESYINSVTLFDVYAFAKKIPAYANNVHSAEVYAVGHFRNGTQIMFTRYYHAVVFDEAHGTVVEKDLDLLRLGDIIVFANRDDNTKNMVDDIYSQLQQAGRFPKSVQEATEKSQYWKLVLREYKETHSLSYRDVAQQLRTIGLSIQEVSVRQWLIEESHIIGPRDKNTLIQIAHLTKDALLLQNPEAYFEACEIVRQQRKKILKLIGKAIVDKLSGLTPTSDELSAFIFENVENLSETLELDDLTFLDKAVPLPATFTNRPIKNMEATL